MITKEFVTAGKAIFTVSNGDKGNWYTYKVTHKPANGQYKESWFVSILSGPDNNSNYTYMGMLDVLTGDVRLTRKSTFTDESQPVRVIRWALNNLWTGKAFPAGYDVQHEGRCGRCGRRLTTPQSLEAGIGPECAGREAIGPVRN